MKAPNSGEETIFETALQLPPQQRAAHLDKLCGDDAALRKRVELLLKSHDQASAEFLEKPTALGLNKTLAVSLPPVEELLGTMIGRYKLLEKVGEGGFGVVYVAEQREPVKRRVALKIIKLGMDTKQVVARFEVERQALALMDHPNIAKVFDAGSTEKGRPYFVMELVRGIRITDYCDQNNLATAERLELFTKVCQAIQHAHQKGIIHRDIKPSNILVTLHDGVPVPKVIDFGIAKATQGELTEHTVYTQLQQFIGTPAYMSPEQAEMSGLDIDTRSDIYALGVLLYELLTGRTPFDQKDLLSAGLEGMRRMIREQEPARPSTRVSSLQGEDRTVTAKRHGLEAPKLVHLLQGDLDWIVMKCLEKDRTRRYETANGVAMDLQRHLNNEPVVARPPTSLYRFQKLIRRNKLAVAAGGAVAAALVLGVIASTLQAVRATRAEREQSRLRSQAQASQKKAETEADKATAISDFLQQMLRSANPDALKGSDYTVRQLLDDFSAGLANQLKDQPEVEAAARATIGRAYYRLGVTDKAQVQIERALALRRRIPEDQAELVAEALIDYAWVCFEQSQFRKGETQAREALDIYRQRGISGQPVISALWVLQKILSQQERFPEVDAVTEEALAIARKSPGGECPELASMVHGLAEAKNKQGKYDEGAALATKAVEMQQRLRGAEHLETAWALVSLEIALREQHKLTEAEAAGREALRIFRKYYSSGHKSVEGALGVLKSVLAVEGDTAGVEALDREIRIGQGVAPGAEQLQVANSLHEFAIAFQQSGKWAEAESAYRQSLAIKRKFAGNESPTVPWSLCGLGSVLQHQGKLAEAEALFREALTIQHALLENGTANVAQSFIDSLDNLLSVLAQQNKSAEATRAARECTEIVLKPRAQDRTQLPPLAEHLAQVLNSHDMPQDAEKVYDDAIRIARQQLGETDVVGAELHHNYAEFLNINQRKFEAAAQQYTRSLPIRRLKQDDKLAWTLAELGFVLTYAGQPSEAETYFGEFLALHRKLFPQEQTNSSAQRPWSGEQHLDIARALVHLADVMKAQNKIDQAESSFHQALEIVSNSVANPTNAGTFNETAWILVAAEPPTDWDATVAVELADKAAAASNRKDPNVLDTLAAAYAATGQFTNAINVEGEAIGLLQDVVTKKDFGSRLKLYESHVPYGNHVLLAKRATALLAQGKFAEAEPRARECLTLREMQIPDAWQTFNARSMLGGSLLGQRHYADAQPLLLSGYEGMKQREAQMPSVGKSRLKETLQRLVQLYEATDLPDQATEWRKRLAEFDQRESGHGTVSHP